jgi:hypothetical protein
MVERDDLGGCRGQRMSRECEGCSEEQVYVLIRCNLR